MDTEYVEVDFIEMSIKSYKNRLAEANQRAIDAIGRGTYSVAFLAIEDATRYQAVIEELEFQLEAAESDHE